MRRQKKPPLQTRWVVFTPDHSTFVSVDGGFMEAFEVLMDHWYGHFYKPYEEFELAQCRQWVDQGRIGPRHLALRESLLRETLSRWRDVRTYPVNNNKVNHKTWHRFFSISAMELAQIVVDGGEPQDISLEAYSAEQDQSEYVQCSCADMQHARSVSIIRRPPVSPQPSRADVDSWDEYREPYEITMRRVVHIVKKSRAPNQFVFPNELLMKIRQHVYEDRPVEETTAISSFLQQEGIMGSRYCCAGGAPTACRTTGRVNLDKLHGQICQTCLSVRLAKTAASCCRLEQHCSACGRHLPRNRRFGSLGEFTLCASCMAKLPPMPCKPAKKRRKFGVRTDSESESDVYRSDDWSDDGGDSESDFDGGWDSGDCSCGGGEDAIGICDYCTTKYELAC